MKISLKCFAKLSEGDVCDFTGSDQHEIPEGETIKGLLTQLGLPQQEIKVVFVNHKVSDFDTVLHDGDQVGLAPPVGAM
ncbi:MAG: MoaD/ThiS family protein [candidate division Zixibacteria bacterium]|nr:MoaD/ThiS family protein [candidate division Zixibacteria bacterium]